MIWDIIPDIHGQAGKLTSLLTLLGYTDRLGAWRHSNPNRTVVFLGDYIDRGPEQAKTLDIVRRMVDAGTAEAIMGNHELNAFHFHTPDPMTDNPLRPHKAANLHQHGAFLREFPLNAAHTREMVDWMASLPLFLEFDDFRVVHAAWNDRSILQIKAEFPDARLPHNDLIEAARPGSDIYAAAVLTTKGPEIKLPHPYSFTDTGGVKRDMVRLNWWTCEPKTWRQIAISVPNPAEIPNEALPDDLSFETYKPNAKPVFFGHYWLDGPVIMQTKNAFCLDYSAGRDGPLVSYTFETGASDLSLANITSTDGH
jgi:hypothetical protein